MGRATHQARQLLHTFPEQKTMQAVVLVKLANGTVDFEGITNYSYGSGAHVELELMQMLNTHYGDIGNLPQQSTIIFAAKWSPCKQCTEELIPDFLRRSNLVARGIRIKFRFEDYYLSDTYPNPNASQKHLWPSQDAANTAYSAISNGYPIYRQMNYIFRDEDNTVTDKVSRHVVFAAAHVNRTSEFETWHL
ncbi:hypothetical protein ACI2KX_03435 [Ectopseudomonas khazarica]|uniref:hypothetical protein n=1 Tax=Ectopseudomonas khazarica TaxID=2502979 RepID=UPI00384D1A7E